MTSELSQYTMYKQTAYTMSLCRHAFLYVHVHAYTRIVQTTSLDKMLNFVHCMWFSSRQGHVIVNFPTFVLYQPCHLHCNMYLTQGYMTLPCSCPTCCHVIFQCRKPVLQYTWAVPDAFLHAARSSYHAIILCHSTHGLYLILLCMLPGHHTMQ